MTKQEILEANKQFEKHFEADDFEALSDCYTSDCKLFPPGVKEPICGRTGAREFFGKAKQVPVKSVTLTTDDITTTGNTLYEEGCWAFKDAEGNAKAGGRYLVVWKQEDGRWRLHRDIFNSA